MHDDGLRHLAEPICAACGGGLEYDGGDPLPEDIVACESCGASATYAEVAANCAAWYEEYLTFIQSGPSKGQIFGWKPKGNYRFAMKIVAAGREEEFTCNPVRLNY